MLPFVPEVAETTKVIGGSESGECDKVSYQV